MLMGLFLYLSREEIYIYIYLFVYNDDTIADLFLFCQLCFHSQLLSSPGLHQLDTFIPLLAASSLL